VTTRYQVLFAGATAERVIRVTPDMRVRRTGGTVGVTMRPAAALAGSTVFLFKLGASGWTQYRTARTSGGGLAAFRKVSTGRYYVGFAGRGAYWATASEPFSVSR